MLLPIEARRCAIIDPVLDFDRRSGTVSHQQAKDILNFIHQRGWGVARVLDTHPHADHFRPPRLAQKTGAFTGIGEKITAVQGLWEEIYNLKDLPAANTVWDVLFADGDVFYRQPAR